MASGSVFTPATDLELQHLREAIHSEVGSTVVNLRPLSGAHRGQQSRVFTAQLGSSQIIVKMGMSPTRCQVEAACFTLCSQYGLPVPQVIGVSLKQSYFVRPFTVLAAARGLPLSDPQFDNSRQELFVNAGYMLRRLHDIPIEGFGDLHFANGKIAGREQSQAVSVAVATSHVRYLFANRMLDSKEAEDLLDVCESQTEMLVSRSCLLHGDFQAPHIFSEGKTITGIIDFGNVSAGDPARDVATTLFYLNTILHKPFLEGYGHSNKCSVVSRYVVLAALRKAWYRHLHSREGIDVALERLRLALKRMDKCPR